jgi:hypothetical protein
VQQAIHSGEQTMPWHRDRAEPGCRKAILGFPESTCGSRAHAIGKSISRPLDRKIR